jgi:hypothetical protein
VENSSSHSKLNSASYMYLGRADPLIITSDFPFISVDKSHISAPQRVLRPIAGVLPQDDRNLSKITGKPLQNTNTEYSTAQEITLENLLPPIQKAPKNTSGESNIQMSNVK